MAEATLVRLHPGVAQLVTSLEDSSQYVAKKINLGNLNEKERRAALSEVSCTQAEVLSNLRHPNVVGYRESFIDEGELIIVMEYCEGGDLAKQVKTYKDSGQMLPEAQIMSWFAQLCLALHYVHQKKVMHRDIKTSNVYLTRTGMVKLGDFGIAKVLENTADVAMTVVGTPYYMSPEVVENKPYSSKSDVWALGCILYELCTLKHAFVADNLLGLVFKILREKYESIPSIYSPDISLLIK